MMKLRIYFSPDGGENVAQSGAGFKGPSLARRRINDLVAERISSAI
jgi:hypothetical protein